VIVLFSTVTWPIPANPEDPRQLRPDMGSPAASGRASRANRAAPSTCRGTPAAPGSLPSEVGDGLQFVSALLAPANSSARLCQASAPTNPRSLPDANCFDVLVSASRKPFACLTDKAQYSNPWSCRRTFSDCHNFGANPQCVAE